MTANKKLESQLALALEHNADFDGWATWVGRTEGKSA